MENFILFNETHGIGEIILNRPAAYNALTHDMILALYQQLQTWANAPHIHAVLISSSHDKVFCAGGDIKKIYEKGKAGDFSVLEFFHDEYQLNHFIYTYPKPYIALLDGLTMGGGVGISVYAKHRIATEKYTFAMPETGIGFFPDIGGSYFLSRCPKKSGVYLGLTGTRITASAAMQLNLVDYVVPSLAVDAIKAALLSLQDYSHETIYACLSAFQHASTENILALDVIERCFKTDSAEEIIKNLKTENSGWSNNLLETLHKKCPLSLKVTLEQLKRGKKLDLKSCLAMEYLLVKHFLHNPNFYEGVRAAVIDKDQNPMWTPSALEQVTEKEVEGFFRE